MEVSVTKEKNLVGAPGVERSKTDVRSITIVPSWTLRNNSLYRQVNLKNLEERVDRVGSSISSTNTLMSENALLNAYMPVLIGLSPSNDKFIESCRQWLSNISITVGANGITLNNSFKYNTEELYESFTKKEQNVEGNYERLDKAQDKALKEALKVRNEELLRIEISKIGSGMPVNVQEYMIYLHCLLYADIAKDTELVYRDNNVRFYIKDEAKAKRHSDKLLKIDELSMKNYLDTITDPEKLDSVFAIYCVRTNKPLAQLMNSENSEKKSLLAAFRLSQPNIFNNICADKYLHAKAFVEKLIARGELIRSEYNQQVSTPDGKIIGANMDAAIAFFSLPANIDLKNALSAKLKA